MGKSQAVSEFSRVIADVGQQRSRETNRPQQLAAPGWLGLEASRRFEVRPVPLLQQLCAGAGEV